MIKGHPWGLRRLPGPSTLVDPVGKRALMGTGHSHECESREAKGNAQQIKHQKHLSKLREHREQMHSDAHAAVSLKHQLLFYKWD